MDYPILSDPTKKVAKAYGVLSRRGFSARVTIIIGKNGNILHIDRKVKARSHGPAVAAKLKELRVEQSGS